MPLKVPGQRRVDGIGNKGRQVTLCAQCNYEISDTLCQARCVVYFTISVHPCIDFQELRLYWCTPRRKNSIKRWAADGDSRKLRVCKIELPAKPHLNHSTLKSQIPNFKSNIDNKLAVKVHLGSGELLDHAVPKHTLCHATQQQPTAAIVKHKTSPQILFRLSV